MEVIFQSLQQIEILLADLVQNILSLPDNCVLLMYSQRGQASKDINTDVAYVSVTPEIDERQTFKNREYVYNEESKQYTISQQSSRTIYASFVFYGPNCSENCTKFCESLFLDSSKLVLQQNYLSLVPERIEGPTLTRELYNSRWYRRCDLRVFFYNTLVVQENVNTFASTDINISFDM